MISESIVSESVVSKPVVSKSAIEGNWGMRKDHRCFRDLQGGLFHGNRGGDSGLSYDHRGGNKGSGDNVNGGGGLDVVVDGGESSVFASGGSIEGSFESSLGFSNLGHIVKVGSGDLNAGEDGSSGL